MHFVKAKGILSPQNGMNLYRGCTHGCIYCDSRSVCYQIKHNFEDIEVKENAPELLEDVLRHKRKKCMISTGSMCDSYMPCEEKLRITRRCIEIIDKYGFGLDIQTKSTRILRDLDIFKSINEKTKCVIEMTLTTFDEELCKKIEPNVSTTYERYKALKIFQENNIPTVVWLSPILPFINDTEENLRGILNLCFDAGVKGIICLGMGVTLREGDREYFYKELDKKFKGIKDKYIYQFGNAYECNSPNNNKLMKIFYDECRKHNVMCNVEKIFSYLKEFPSKENIYEQLSLF